MQNIIIQHFRAKNSNIGSLILFVFAVLPALVSAQYNYTKGDSTSGNTFINNKFHTATYLNDVKPQSGKKAINVIVLIGDGMGSAHTYAAYTANGGQLNMFNMPFTGFSRTQSTNNYITDSGAGGTALACGVRTKNGAIGVDSSGRILRNLSEIMAEKRKKIGLVSTSSITHATPASFIAHEVSRSSEEDIAAAISRSEVDVFIGGGLKFFSNRTDKLNFLDTLKSYGFNVSKSIADASGNRAAVLLADVATPTYPKRGEMLPEATSKSIELLSKGKNGFFLMVEGSQIDWGSHANNLLYAINETLDFDRAVGRALEFAKQDLNTLVIVTADHETGGMSLTGGDIKKGMVKAEWTSKDHTGIMVPVFAFGPGAEHFTGVYNNTEIFNKILRVVK
jgi:alkaline phosphatase